MSRKLRSRAPYPLGMAENVLYYGDNLEILPKTIDSETVDLVYLDPPFNSNKEYNVLFKSQGGEESQAQLGAFDDSWRWSPQAQEAYSHLLSGGAPSKVADALEAMRKVLGTSDVLAYVVMMTARLIELHRVLKPEGSLYLHCDPTASPYLRIILDSIFGAERFVNEIVWKRYGSHNDQGQGAAHYGRTHDTIFLYGKSDRRTWNQAFGAYDEAYLKTSYRYDDNDGRGRYRTKPLTAPGGEAKGNPTYEWHGHVRSWRYNKERMQELDDDRRLHYSKTGYASQKHYLSEAKGVPVQDWWGDVPALTGQNAERLHYPTQKPLALLERIINVSSNEGDLVLDPFCGCGTTIDAAQKLGRRWIGIDVAYLAVDLIDKRLRGRYTDDIASTYRILGIPRDLDGARALFAENPFDFEIWAVSQVDGQPNQKQVGDRGVDGLIRFPIDNANGIGRALVSVKGGRQLNPAMVRDLVGTVEQQKADMGILVCLERPTKGMTEVADRAGSYSWPVDGRSFPRIQILTAADLLADKKPAMPTPFLPYVQARRLVDENALRLF